MNRIILTLILCGASIQAENIGSKAGQRVTVWLDDRTVMPAGTVWRATAVASEIFESIGVHIQWKTGKPRLSDVDRDTECSHTERPIAVTVFPFAPGNDATSSWAFANIRTGAISVFYDRIRYSALSFPGRIPTCLGYTFAHEVAHVLQTIGRHADSGIMKAKWTFRDYREMEAGTLLFTPADIRLIQYGAVSQSCPLPTEVASQ